MAGNRIKERYSVTMTPEINEQAHALAKARGMNLSLLIEQLLRGELEADRAKQREQAAANRGRVR